MPNCLLPKGYHDIISVLYLTLLEEDQLLCAEKLSLHRLRDAMGDGLEPLLGLLRLVGSFDYIACANPVESFSILKYLLRIVDAEYAALLER